MNFFAGFIVIFAIGLPIIIFLSELLEKNSYSSTQVIIAKLFFALILVSIPPLLTFFGRNEAGETLLARLGKPITTLGSLLIRSSSTNTIIVVLLIIIINILIWK